MIAHSKRQHALRSRLCIELEGTLKCMVEPVQSAVSLFPELYDSAMLTGNVALALTCRRLYCNGIFFTGKSDLMTCSKHLVKCIQQSVRFLEDVDLSLRTMKATHHAGEFSRSNNLCQEKYQLNTNLHCTMSTFRACTYLTGESNSGVDIMSFDNLRVLAESTNDILLQ